MPEKRNAKVKLPDGSTLTLRVGANATEEDVKAEVERLRSMVPARSTMRDQPTTEDLETPEADRIRQYVQQRNAPRPETPPPETRRITPLSVGGEFAAAGNRAVLGAVDMVPEAINAGLRLGGREEQLPTTMGAMEGTGIEGGFMPPGMARDATQAAGSTAVAGAAMKSVPRDITKAGNAALDFIGAGSSTAAKQAGTGLALAAGASKERAGLPSASTTGDTARDMALKRRSGDTSTFGYRVDNEGRLLPDPVQRTAARQGIPEDVVTMVNSSTPRTKERYSEMLDAVNAGMTDRRARASRRPLDVVGDSVAERLQLVHTVNRQAGERLDEVAETLQGQPVNLRQPLERLRDDLSQMGIGVTRGEDGSPVIDFSGSDIEDLSAPERVVRSMINRLFKNQQPDAFDIHRLKRFIDNQVAYGGGADGLDAKTENVFKRFRHNLDGMLDGMYPEYDAVNTEYSDTIQALNALQDVAGKKVDLLGDTGERSLGTLARRVTSNAISGGRVSDAFKQLDEVAKKYLQVQEGTGRDLVPLNADQRSRSVNRADYFDDDLTDLVEFASVLEPIFGPAASTSLAGELNKAQLARDAAEAASGSPAGFMMRGVEAGWNKLTKPDQKKALDALRELSRNDR